MKKNRILFVADDLTVANGRNLQLQILANRLPTEQFEVHIATCCQGKIPGEWPAVQVHRSPVNQVKASRILELAELAKSIRADTIHSWGWRNLWSTALAAKRFGLPKAVFSFFQKPGPRPTWQNLLEEKIVGQNAKLVCSHQVIAEHLAGFDSVHTVRVIKNAFMEIKSDGARQRLLDRISVDDPVFLAGSVASAEPRFRLKDLVWAADQLKRVREDVHFLVFGYDFADGNLQRFISQTGSIENIHLLSAENLTFHDLGGLDVYWNLSLIHI